MKTFFKDEEQVMPHQIKKSNLLDTCFLVYALSHPKELKDIKSLKDVAITSFNVEELLHIGSKIKAGDRHKLKRLLKEVDFKIINIDISPGNPKQEKQFVSNIDENLLKHIQDPSDAVLIAVGILTKSNVYTRDKHHLFNTDLKNYLNQEHNIEVLNVIK